MLFVIRDESLNDLKYLVGFVVDSFCTGPNHPSQCGLLKTEPTLILVLYT